MQESREVKPGPGKAKKAPAKPAGKAKEEPPKPRGRPTGIVKTETGRETKLHFGSYYNHTLSGTGGSIEDVYINEKVTKVRDDFNTKLKGVQLGEIPPVPVNKNNVIGDRIWLSFGAIIYAVRDLQSNKKSLDSQLGCKEDHQELYYTTKRPENEAIDWKKDGIKFADVTIKTSLHDIGGELTVVTEDNGVMAPLESFRPIPEERLK